jgi:DNA-binding GntR family transcriptional regulator
LASELGISRGPLREALRFLETEQLVVNYPRRGTFVTKLSREDLISVYQAREMIECYAVDLINEDKTRGFLEKVSKKNLMRNPPPTPTSTQEERKNFIDKNNSFHFALVETTNNPWIIRSYQTLSSTMARCQFVFVLNRKIANAARKEHQRLLDLIKMGDYEGGKTLIKFHINTFLEHLLSQNDSKVEAANMP